MGRKKCQLGAGRDWHLDHASELTEFAGECLNKSRTCSDLARVQFILGAAFDSAQQGVGYTDSNRRAQEVLRLINAKRGRIEGRLKKECGYFSDFESVRRRR